MKNTGAIIPSVNYHLLQQCNMRCKYCFAGFNNEKSLILPLSEQFKLIKSLADFGFTKITFVGGEPLIYKQLDKLIAYAKQQSLTTMVVTNGSLLTPKWIEQNAAQLDWIGLSVDSTNIETNTKAGRHIAASAPMTANEYLNLCRHILANGIRLKINTVVHAHNCTEDMADFIAQAKPERWKVMKMLCIKGENDHPESTQLLISDTQYADFVARHNGKKLPIVAETDNDMKGSYVMISPAGNFFTNETGEVQYSQSIAKEGVYEAFAQMNYDYNKFIGRKGMYKWAS